MTAPIVPVNLRIPHIAAPQISCGGGAFQAAFQEAVSKVEDFGRSAQASIDRFLSGEGEELHQVALKTHEAELSFDLFLQVRNKIIAAYQEVMRMQV